MLAADKRLVAQAEAQECIAMMLDLTGRLESLPWDLILAEQLMAIGDAWLKLKSTMTARSGNRDEQGPGEGGSIVAEPVKEESNPPTEEKKGA